VAVPSVSLPSSTWAAYRAALALVTGEVFQHQDRLFDVLPFGPEVGQHFGDVQRGYDRTVLGMRTSVETV
jgi:hypothetical protein